MKILSRVNYYKLSGYCYQLKNSNSEKFFEGVNFKQIYNIYIFDKRLSSLLMDLMESIEISLKTVVANHLGMKYGPLMYKEEKYFKDYYFYENFIENFNKNKKRSKNDKIFIKHNLDKYGDLPIWVAVEIFSFTTISKFYRNMLSEDKNIISKKYYFNVGSDKLENRLHVSTNIRNICAHYARLYNIYLPYNLKMFNDSKKENVNNKSLFAYILISKKLIRNDQQWERFTNQLENLITDFNSYIEIARMGFPENWLKLLKRN